MVNHNEFSEGVQPLNPLIQTLIVNFAAQHAVYKDGAYNETQLRRDFLDGFIASLGWDVNNASGSHETFREVVHEDRLSIAGQSKAPDYCVQLGGRKLFYVEAKKPAVNIGADAGRKGSRERRRNQPPPREQEQRQSVPAQDAAQPKSQGAHSGGAVIRLSLCRIHR